MSHSAQRFSVLQTTLEPALTDAVNAVADADAADPVAFVSAHLGSRALAAATPPPPAAETQTDKWSLVSWLKGAGVHRVVAGALQAARHGADDEAMLDFIRRLPDRAALEKHICSGMVLSGIGVCAVPHVRAGFIHGCGNDV